jgi:hypothetical protein
MRWLALCSVYNVGYHFLGGSQSLFARLQHFSAIIVPTISGMQSKIKNRKLQKLIIISTAPCPAPYT